MSGIGIPELVVLLFLFSTFHALIMIIDAIRRPASLYKMGSKGMWIFLMFLLGPLASIPYHILNRWGNVITKDRIAAETSAGLKKCPHCAEMVKQEARVCRYCQRDIA